MDYLNLGVSLLISLIISVVYYFLQDEDAEYSTVLALFGYSFVLSYSVLMLYKYGSFENIKPEEVIELSSTPGSSVEVLTGQPNFSSR